ncbi:MFS transporter [Gordonia crocea]|uniref:MFS transporter n=1 Tax=Gordonia crocea TaxID=589162 RepID=A0A7I9V2G1_9ACTN|nr:MFS transporter [Gordonia crocea]GED99343.1 MFS transporter [Gordonia crocea]
MSAEATIDDHSPAPSAPRRLGLLIATVFGLQFLVGLDTSLVNIALSDIKVDLAFSDAGLQWIVTAYLLCFAGFLLVGGRLGDIWGRRRTVVSGLAVFALASAVGGLAQSPGVLVGARAVQGIAGALLAPAALALVATITDARARRTAMAVWGGASAAGGAVGVVASGLLTEAFGWQAVMFANLPIVGLVLAGALACVPRGEQAAAQMDLLGGVLVTAGLGALVYAVTATGEHGWSSSRAVVGFLIAIVLLVGFVTVERASDHPMMPIRVLATRSIVGANVFGFMLAAGQLAAFYFCSLYLQQVWDLTPRAAGVLFLPFCLFVVVGIALATKLATRFGARPVIVGFGLIGAAGLAMFARLPGTYDFWLGMFAPSVVTAIGIGGSMMLIGVAGTAGVPAADAGIASGVLNSSRQLGGTIGLAALVTLAAQYPVAADGFRAGLAIAAGLLVVASLAAGAILPRSRG